MVLQQWLHYNCSLLRGVFIAMFVSKQRCILLEKYMHKKIPPPPKKKTKTLCWQASPVSRNKSVNSVGENIANTNENMMKDLGD